MSENKWQYGRMSSRKLIMGQIFGNLGNYSHPYDLESCILHANS